jgi:hypothetical protein
VGTGGGVKEGVAVMVKVEVSVAVAMGVFEVVGVKV